GVEGSRGGGGAQLLRGSPLGVQVISDGGRATLAVGPETGIGQELRMLLGERAAFVTARRIPAEECVRHRGQDLTPQTCDLLVIHERGVTDRRKTSPELVRRQAVSSLR